MWFPLKSYIEKDTGATPAAAWLAQLVGPQTTEREVAGLNPGRTNNQGPKITGRYDHAGCAQHLILVQMIASLGSDI